MTKPAERTAEQDALLRARARRLTDPLGAKGFRSTSRRIDEERTARRATFVTVLGGFMGVFGLLAWNAQHTPAEVITPVSLSGTAANEAPLDNSRFTRGATNETSAATTTTMHKRTRSS